MRKGKEAGQVKFARGTLYTLIQNPLFIGKVRYRDKCYEGRHAAIVSDELWTQVQNLVAYNRQCKIRRTHAKDPSLLAGRIFDDRKNPLSPTHTHKHNRRYQYYVSQADLQYRKDERGSVIRVPAQSVEDIVIRQIKKIFRSEYTLMQAIDLTGLSAPRQKKLIAKARVLAVGWDDLGRDQQIGLILSLIQKITVGRDEFIILFSRSALAKELGQEVDPTDEPYEVTVPVCLKRCGIETKLVILNRDSSPAHPASIQAIQKALAKTLEWNQALITGTASTMTELARKDGVAQRYVSVLIKLAFLAPDVMEAIIKGKIPSALTLGRLKDGFPLDWVEQRKVLGFSG